MNISFQHFEHLWEACEKANASELAQRSVHSLLAELTAKFSLYATLEDNNKLNIVDRQKLKARLFGALLFTLTQLTAKDDINSFAALQEALTAVQLEKLEVGQLL
jgi:hypothetical protein